jgi:hypothetical protein
MISDPALAAAVLVIEGTTAISAAAILYLLLVFVSSAITWLFAARALRPARPVGAEPAP